VGEVVVRTSDFRLAYRLLAGLKARQVRCAHLERDAPLPPSARAWIATHEEVAAAADPLGIGASLESVESSIDAALRFVAQGGSVRDLTFGIDPGPRPGLAWVGDGRVLGSGQLESVDATIDRICTITGDIEHERITVRIGDGSRTISNRLANICLARGLPVERVDEARTSEGLPRHQHHASAARIAQLGGTPIRSKQPVVPTPGEVKEVQRLSRRHSGGRVTISQRLAQAVAVGRLSMEEAIHRQLKRPTY
jgi:hypothetical protein